jgi:hypothetical protein
VDRTLYSIQTKTKVIISVGYFPLKDLFNHIEPTSFYTLLCSILCGVLFSISFFLGKKQWVYKYLPYETGAKYERAVNSLDFDAEAYKVYGEYDFADL